MLIKIQKTIGGIINYEKRKGVIIKVKWSAIAQKDVDNCLRILNKYPLLTSRKICQLNYYFKTREFNTWEYHLLNRDSKYNDQDKIVSKYRQQFIFPSYFPAWLSGFTEAEGCFRSTHRYSFYICQNNDDYILQAIKTYFNSNHKISINKDTRPNRCQLHYRISMSGKLVNTRIKNHFELYPLLGNKNISFLKWKDFFSS